VLSQEYLINFAKKSVPSFKWVIGAAAVLALAATVLQWGVKPLALGFLAVFLLVLAVALVVLQWIARLKPAQSSRLAVAMAWAFMLLLVAVPALALTSAATDWPWPLKTAISRAINPGPERLAIVPAAAPAMTFVPELTFEGQDLERIQYDFMTGVTPAGRPDELLTLTKAEFGLINGKEHGWRAVFQYRNTGSQGVPLSAEAKFFTLRNNRGDTVTPVDFQGPPLAQVVGAGQTRDLAVTFATTAWHRKDSGVRELYFEVINFTPLARAGWKVRPPVAAGG